MHWLFNRLRWIFLSLFALVSAGLWTYDALYIWPRQHCEAKGDWWDSVDGVCAVPMPLTHWTGRPLLGPGQKAAATAEPKASK